MNNPMEYFRKGAEKRKAESLKGKSMYENGDEVYGPKTQSQAELEKLQILNDMGLLGNQEIITPKPLNPNKPIPHPGFDQAGNPLIQRSPANPPLTPDDIPPEHRPSTDKHGRPIRPRSMVHNAMMRKLRGQ